MLLSQGRAVGELAVAAVQDPRRDVLPFRGLFPTRVALRLLQADQVDLVLGDGARDRVAECDRISYTQPGSRARQTSDADLEAALEEWPQ